jgi:hypothetical protein
MERRIKVVGHPVHPIAAAVAGAASILRRLVRR